MNQEECSKYGNNVFSFTSRVITSYVREALRIYKMQGKGALGRYLKDSPEKYKSEIIKTIKAQLNETST